MKSSSAYEPAASFDVELSDIEYRASEDGSCIALIYQPKGTGPFPALLEVHGGAWTAGGRTTGELMNRALASSGIVVAAVDFRLAPRYPYPAQVADVNYAIRWLKTHASEFNADPGSIGAMGSSSGGHTVILNALRPHDSRYTGTPLGDGSRVDATVLYVVARWPISDPYARYIFARETSRDGLVTATESYFLTQDAIKEGNPQQILERKEEVNLPPTLVLQGTADLNLPLSIPNRFLESYRAAGGCMELEYFPDMPHGFGNDPSSETDRALELVKAFVARQLRSAAQH